MKLMAVSPLCPLSSSINACAAVAPMLIDDEAPVDAEIEGVVVIREIGSMGSSNLNNPFVSSLLIGAKSALPEALLQLDK